MNTTNTFSGYGNRGFQLGSNSGHVSVNINERAPTKPNPSSTVPFRRDPHFVDRDILAKVGEKCSKPASRVALVGLGGVGKSQLAIEYSYQIREKFPQTWIFWVHASNAARFEEGYRMIADRVKLSRRDEPTADILQLVSNWLCDEENGRWIMILDNADDPKVFSDPRKGKSKSDVSNLTDRAVSLSTFLPQTPNGSILVTSRSENAALSLIGSHHDIIKVEPMEEGSALLLFEKKLRGGFDEDDGLELLRALDYMPLAISQAAAYISQRAPRTTLAGYLKDFRQSDRNRANLLNRDTTDLRRDSKASNSVITTWQISFEYIRGERPSAARLLSLMSFFDRQGIPEFLLHDYDSRADGSKIDLKSKNAIDLEDDNHIEFEDDLLTLTNYSLIAKSLKRDQFEMHRLVQLATRKWLELNNELEQWKNKYIQIISEAFPIGVYENWPTCRVLYPHAEVVLSYRPLESQYLMKWSDVLDKASFYATTQGNYLTAEEMNKRALEEKIKELGEEHPHTLTSVSNLASLLECQGKYKAAEELNRQALDGREKTLGKEHPDTLTSVSNLAGVLRLQGQYEAAEELNRQALDGKEKALGKEHPDTLTSLNNLGLVLQFQGKYEEAEELIRRALDGAEKTLGKEHPDTLKRVNNLGLVLQFQGKYEEAEELTRRALDGAEKTLGKEHPDTLTSINNLALVLRLQGQYKDATPLYERACAGIQKVLGVNHPTTLTCSENYSFMIEEMNANPSRLRAASPRGINLVKSLRRACWWRKNSRS